MSRLHEVVKHGDDVRKIMEAIGSGIDSTDIQDELRDLGLNVGLDTIDWGNEFGTIIIEGGNDEDSWCQITLKLVKIEVGFDTLNVQQIEGKGE